MEWDFWAVIISLVTLSLAALGALIAIASVWIVIWGRPWVEELVRRAAADAISSTERELRGLLNGYVGFMFGRLRTVNPDFINSAIDFSARAYELLPQQANWKRQARNNLAFYYATRGYITDAAEALGLAKILYEQDYPITKNVDYATTWAAVVARYYDSMDRPRQRLLEAERMMEELVTRDDVAIPQKQSAARHLSIIRAALTALGGG